jgi:hypothetical protein
MSSTLEGTLRFLAVTLILILPALATYLNQARSGGGTRRDEPSAKTPTDAADRSAG